MSYGDDPRYMSDEVRIENGYKPRHPGKAVEHVTHKPHPRAYLESLSVERLLEIANDPKAGATERGWARRVADRKSS